MGKFGKPERSGAPKKSEACYAGELFNWLHTITGITREKMAEELGISRTAYHEYFKRDVRMDTLVKVVSKFGYHIEVRPGDTGLIQIRDDTCETCEFRRFVEQTEGGVVIDFYPDKKGVDLNCLVIERSGKGVKA